MLRAHVQIKGTKPILFHRFNIEVLNQATKVKSGTSGNNPEEWRSSFFHDDGKIYIPGDYVAAALKNGSVNTKVGRGTIQKTWMSAVTIETPKVFFNRAMPKDWEEMKTEEFPTDIANPVFLDVRMVANPNTKGRNVRYRVGLSAGWECEFDLEIDDLLISKQQIEKVISDTGKMQGIADGRTLGYGRYTVTDIAFEKID